MSVIGALVCGAAISALIFGHWSPFGYVFWSVIGIVAAWETYRARKRGD